MIFRNFIIGGISDIPLCNFLVILFVHTELDFLAPLHWQYLNSAIGFLRSVLVFVKKNTDILRGGKCILQCSTKYIDIWTSEKYPRQNIPCTKFTLSIRSPNFCPIPWTQRIKWSICLSQQRSSWFTLSDLLSQWYRSHAPSPFPLPDPQPDQ